MKQTIPAGPRARRVAQETLDELLRRVEEGRQPKTNASLQHLIQRHLEVCGVEPRTLTALCGYLDRHITPLIGDRSIGTINAEVLDSLYAQLRRCRDHCDGRSAVIHRTAGEHPCYRRCRPERLVRDRPTQKR